MVVARGHITNRLREHLKLMSIRKEKLILKWFAATEGTLKCLDVVQLCIMVMKDISVYIEALCIPHICSPVKVPKNECLQSYFKHLRKLWLARPSRG